MPYIFGPVPSRRLGLSLGIDLIPAKICTYDCLYCQVGRTTCKNVETKSFVPVPEVLRELERKVEEIKPDTITLAGSGEPTLHSQIDQVIAFIKKITGIKSAILTNGSLFWNEEIRSRVVRSDIIMPTLSTSFEATFRAIHRPHSALTLKMLTEGLINLRQIYPGRMFLEVVLLAGFNDSEKEIEGLKRVIDRVSPDKIQLNTVVRPPADYRAVSLGRKRLEEIKDFFGEKAEVIARTPLKQKKGPYDSWASTILEMAKRRPLKTVDIAHILNLSLEETEKFVKSLLTKEALYRQEHSGEVYYSKNPLDRKTL
ncbi:MAG: radical SAM protein [Desulfatiglandales bacterium]|nr:radical SAM protein [Desulfatiglandales bacterium]